VPSPVDRARTGSLHHLLVDTAGVPLAVTLTGGNRNDTTELLPFVDGITPVAGRIGRPRQRPTVASATDSLSSETRTSSGTSYLLHCETLHALGTLARLGGLGLRRLRCGLGLLEALLASERRVDYLRVLLLVEPGRALCRAWPCRLANVADR
jgi:hypothetical protein